MTDPPMIERVAKVCNWVRNEKTGRWYVDPMDSPEFHVADAYRLTDSGLRILEDALLKAGAAHDYAKGQYFWWLWKSRFAGTIGEQLGADESREVAAMTAYLSAFEDTTLMTDKWITAAMGSKLIRQIEGFEHRVEELERSRKSLKKKLQRRSSIAKKQFAAFKALRAQMKDTARQESHESNLESELRSKFLTEFAVFTKSLGSLMNGCYDAIRRLEKENAELRARLGPIEGELNILSDLYRQSSPLMDEEELRASIDVVMRARQESKP